MITTDTSSTGCDGSIAAGGCTVLVNRQGGAVIDDVTAAVVEVGDASNTVAEGVPESPAANTNLSAESPPVVSSSLVPQIIKG